VHTLRYNNIYPSLFYYFNFRVLHYDDKNREIPTINVVGSLVKSGIRALVYRFANILFTKLFTISLLKKKKKKKKTLYYFTSYTLSHLIEEDRKGSCL
jgi:hypothetical protein